ncbi:MAG: 6-hydroxymethyl-7,8-dihydropterin pyrophosphokinase [Methanonatronarchaeales archaeon]|nr:6-hydroxymethyl-7,8-dihydropterin pyrophosphokinase [Methanonatronarchaeales archaeon]
MRYREWEPYYHEILEEFGYSEDEDRRSAEHLARMTAGKRIAASDVRRVLRGDRVTVVGDAPSLPRELDSTEPPGVLVAADGATTHLLARGIVPEVVVTDLDGDPVRLADAEERGSIINVHAHGDNREPVDTWVPTLEAVLPTCQCRPFDGLYNFGGFTDGDRAAFMADELGAASIGLFGFDFDDYPSEEKGRKLAWARRLLGLLEPDNLG